MEAKYSGGSVMVWSYISAGGVGELVKNDEITNAVNYHQILIHCESETGSFFSTIMIPNTLPIE